MLKDFRDFIMRGNVVDMAVGIIMGAAFGGIVTSLVNDVLMPPLGLLMGRVDFSNLFVVLQQGAKAAAPYATLAAAKDAGAVTINYGFFVNTLINFLIVAIAVFVLVRAVKQLERKPQAAPAAPTTKQCPFCFSTIHLDATRCPNCTSELKKGQ